MKRKKILNLGCGNDYRKSTMNVEWVNIEVDKTKRAEKYHDLNKLPYPFKKDEFDEIYFNHVIEHLQLNFIALFKELSRILKKGGILRLNCPHFSYVKEMGHVSEFSYRDLVSNPQFDVVSGTLHNTYENYFRSRHISIPVRIFNFVVEYLANKNPIVFERFWCYWVGGIKEMRFVLKNNKYQQKSDYKNDFINGEEFL